MGGRTAGLGGTGVTAQDEAHSIIPKNKPTIRNNFQWMRIMALLPRGWSCSPSPRPKHWLFRFEGARAHRPLAPRINEFANVVPRIGEMNHN